MNDRPWLAHYDKGVPQTIEIPEAPLFYFLEEAARKYPDRACTIFKGAVISYREMNALTDHMAAALVEMGVKKGDRVLYGRYSGNDVTVDGHEYLIIRESDILAVY